jgi:hypothetical protein
MTGHEFRRTLRRSWLPALLLVYAGIFGAILYSGQTIQAQAEATVAVRDPISVRPTDYQAAQITFDAIINSRRLSERVAARLGRTPEDVEGRLSVEVIQSEAAFNISPLYGVVAEDETEARALEVVDVAVEEARALFVELNQVSDGEVEATLAPEREQAAVDLAAAQTAFDTFVADNDSADLQTRLTALNSEVSRLRDQASEATADLAGVEASQDAVAVAVVRQRLESFEDQLRVASAERDRLQVLQPTYTELRTTLDRATARMQNLDDLAATAALSQLDVVESQVKVLDDGRIQSQTLMKVLVHAVGLMLGLLAAASLVYMRAASAAARESAESIALDFGAPVLGVIPRGSLRKVKVP